MHDMGPPMSETKYRPACNCWVWIDWANDYAHKKFMSIAVYWDNRDKCEFCGAPAEVIHE